MAGTIFYPIYKWLAIHSMWAATLCARFFSMVWSLIGGFYQGPLAPVKWIVTFILLMALGIWFWIRSYKKKKAFMDSRPIADPLENLINLGLISGMVVRVGQAFAIIQFAMELFVARHYDEFITPTSVSRKFSAFDAGTWPWWAVIAAAILVIRLAVILIFSILKLKPLNFLGELVHVLNWASIGLFTGSVVLLLEHFLNYIQTGHHIGLGLIFTIPITLFNMLVLKIIPGIGYFVLIMMLLGVLAIIFWPFLCLIANPTVVDFDDSADESESVISDIMGDAVKLTIILDILDHIF